MIYSLIKNIYTFWLLFSYCIKLMQKRGNYTYNLNTPSQILLVVFIGYLLTVTLYTSFLYIVIFLTGCKKISKISLLMTYFVMEKSLINRTQEYWRYWHFNLNFKKSPKLIFMHRMYSWMYEMGLYLYGHCLISNSNHRTQNVEYLKYIFV